MYIFYFINYKVLTIIKIFNDIFFLLILYLLIIIKREVSIIIIILVVYLHNGQKSTVNVKDGVFNGA